MTLAATRLLTAADLAALPSELPSGPVLYELWQGVLLTMAPPGDIHGDVEFAIGLVLGKLGQDRGYGRGRSGETTIVLGRNPDTIVGADVIFLTSDQLPPRRSPEGYLETIPALVVEVRSKNDTDAGVAAKVALYLAAGVRVVWVADPARRTISIHRSGQPVVELAAGNTLTADGIIPGFAVPVAELFTGV
jgi:Uma2 family endonuclease